MRRRIYAFDLSDVTNDPYMFADDAEGVKALYDEALWEKLINARKYVRELESEVARALVAEPFDDVEKALHAESQALVNGGEFTLDASNSIRERALAHAKTRRRPGKKLTEEGKKRLDALVDQYKPKP